MWPFLSRTRRHLHRFGAASPDPTQLAGTAAQPSIDGAVSADGPAPCSDVVLTIGRVDLDRLGTALQALLDPGMARPDTPDRLEAALAAAVERLGGAGRPRVTRLPPALYTPEAWQVRMTSLDPAIGDAIRGATHGLGFVR